MSKPKKTILIKKYCFIVMMHEQKPLLADKNIICHKLASDDDNPYLNNELHKHQKHFHYIEIDHKALQEQAKQDIDEQNIDNKEQAIKARYNELWQAIKKEQHIYFHDEKQHYYSVANPSQHNKFVKPLKESEIYDISQDTIYINIPYQQKDNKDTLLQGLTYRYDEVQNMVKITANQFENISEACKPYIQAKKTNQQLRDDEVTKTILKKWREASWASHDNVTLCKRP